MIARGQTRATIQDCVFPIKTLSIMCTQGSIRSAAHNVLERINTKRPGKGKWRYGAAGIEENASAGAYFFFVPRAVFCLLGSVYAGFRLVLGLMLQLAGHPTRRQNCLPLMVTPDTERISTYQTLQMIWLKKHDTPQHNIYFLPAAPLFSRRRASSAHPGWRRPRA